DHLTHAHVLHVARDDAVDESHRVETDHDVLVERRDVDERDRIANGVVLVLVVRLVRTHRVVAPPFAVGQALAKGERALVESGSDGHGYLRALARSFRISRLAFAPDAPITAPPGCVPDPQR